MENAYNSGRLYVNNNILQLQMCICRKNKIQGLGVNSRVFMPEFMDYTIKITHFNTQTHTLTQLHIQIYKFTILNTITLDTEHLLQATAILLLH